MRGRAVVLGSGVNALTVIRSLGRRGIAVRLLTDEAADFARRSRYTIASSVAADDEQTAIEQVLAEGGHGDVSKPVLYFTSDRYLRLVAKHADVLRDSFAFVVSSWSAVETVTEKAKFAHFATRHGVRVPRTTVVSSLSEIEDAGASAAYPVALKPDDSMRWKDLGVKLVRVDDAAELVDRYRAFSGRGETMLIQQYIGGPDDRHFSFVSYRSADGRERAALTLQKVRIHPIHAGVGVFVRVVSEPELERIGRATLDALGYVGASSVCFKVDASSEEPFVHEVNGRLPLAHGAASLVGIDLSYLMYADALRIDSRQPKPSRSRDGSAWVTMPADVRAFRAYRRNGEITLREWLRSYRDVRVLAEVTRDDLGPLRAIAHGYLRRLIRRRGETREARP